MQMRRTTPLVDVFERLRDRKVGLDADIDQGVEEIAMLLCTLRCLRFDRDPWCQAHNRCGTNWRLYVPKVLELTDRICPLP